MSKDAKEIKSLDAQTQDAANNWRLIMDHSGKPTVRERIEAKLTAAFAPQFLKVVDESHQHAGHAGHDGGAGHGGETHFRVQIISPDFLGKTRIERHRAINTLLADEIAGGVHALALEIKAPNE